MFNRIIKPFKGLDIRVKVAIASLGLTSFTSRMTNRYDPLYAADLGANAVDIGVLSSISSAFSSIIAIPMGWAVENYSLKKVMLLNLTLFAVHLVIMGVSNNWLMLIPAYIISTRLLRLGPLADITFVTAVKPKRRGTVISLSRVIQNILSVFAPMTAAIIVTYFGGPIINAQGIRPLYFFELAIITFVFIMVTRYLPPTLGRVDKREKSGKGWSSLISDYGNALKGEKYLKRWVILRIIQTFCTSFVNPFLAIWLVEFKGADAITLGVIGSTSLIVTLILQIPAGNLADRIGRKKVYFTLYSMTFVGAILAILAPSKGVLIFAGLIGGYATGALGGGMAGVATPLLVTWWWESVPEEKRGRFFGIEGLFNLASIPASFLGGILWEEGYILPVLIIPILIELIVVFPLLATVPDIIRSKH
jgi:MFS family permease